MNTMQPLPDDSVKKCPFWSRRVTLAHVGADKSIVYTHGILEKENYLRALIGGGLGDAWLFLAWTGHYSTDLYAVTRDNAAHWLAVRAF